MKKKKRACFGFTYKLQNDMTPSYSTMVPCTILLSLLSHFFFFLLNEHGMFLVPPKRECLKETTLGVFSAKCY